jgi:transcriptional regulator GlxA family with amidase domain
MKQRRVSILLFDDAEVLDFAGPFEVFSVANELNENPLFKVSMIAFKDGPVRARNGLSVNPDYTIGDCPQPDILIIPGGLGTRPLIKEESLIEWIAKTSKRSELTLSVCTGSLLLAKAGLLEGMNATTHHLAFKMLKKLSPGTTILSGQRYVDNGHLITAAGVSAGIDMSLYVISKILGEDQAEKTALYMEYDWCKG